MRKRKFAVVLKISASNIVNESEIKKRVQKNNASKRAWVMGSWCQTKKVGVMALIVCLKRIIKLLGYDKLNSMGKLTILEM